MKTQFITLISTYSINWPVIGHDIVMIYLPLFCIAFIFLCIWSTHNYKRSIKAEYEDQIDHLRLKNINQGIEIEMLKNEVKLCRYAILEYKEDAISEITKLRAKLAKTTRKRNPDGSFAITSGKGHGKRKTEIDWTKKTEAELLAEAKRRYPVGTKVICLEDNEEYRIIDFDHDGSCQSEIWCNSDSLGVELYLDGKWAQIIT